MTAPIDPIRRLAQTRKVGRAQVHARRGAEDSHTASAASEAAKPLIVDPVDEAAFNAHKMGQERRRGVRAGHETLDTAKSAYTRTEWSGAKDRRAPAGWIAKTKI